MLGPERDDRDGLGQRPDAGTLAGHAGHVVHLADGVHRAARRSGGQRRSSGDSGEPSQDARVG